MSEPVTVALSKPVRVIDNMVSSITLNPPTGRQIMKAGATTRFFVDGDGNTAVEPVPEGLGKLIALCGNVPFSTVEDMAASDFTACMTAVMSFLGPDATSSTLTSTSPSAGTA